MKFGMVTQIGRYGGQTVQISKFSKTKMAAAAILKKNTKIAISQQRMGRSSRNLAWIRKVGLLTAQTVKKFEFLKSKMAEPKQ